MYSIAIAACRFECVWLCEEEEACAPNFFHYGLLYSVSVVYGVMQPAGLSEW